MINLPPELEPFCQEIEDSFLDYLQIKINPNLTQLWESKFGGLPYFPKNKNIDYPVNDKGEYLALIAQLNFSEIPPLNNFPKQGILQIFIDPHDDLYGLDFNNQISQKRFRVLYHPEVEKQLNNLVRDFSFLPNLKSNYYFPIRGEFRLQFIANQAPAYPYDEYFAEYLPELNKPENSFFLELYEQFYEQFYGENLPDALHCLGGYPYFTQSDPRMGIYKQNEPYKLLLQIDSEYFAQGQEICWGDAGIANFFIQSSALQQLDFSQILYNWDCT